MNSKIIKIICLILVFAISVFSFSACKNKETVASSKPSASQNDNTVSSEDDTSSEQDVSSEEEATELDDSEVFEEDVSSEEEPDFDETPQEQPEEEIVEDEPFVSTINIFNKTPVNKNFGGLGAVYHAYAYRDDAFGRKYDDKTAAFEIKRAANSGISSARTFYDMSLAWDSKNKKWDWDSADMNAVYKWAEELDNYGVEVFLTFQTSWQYLFTSYHWSDETSDGTLNWSDDPNSKVAQRIHEGILVAGDQTATLEKFGLWWADTLKAFESRGIKNVSRIAIATEPGAWWEEEWGDIEGSKAYHTYQEKSAKSQADAINVVSRVLKENNLRDSVKIVGPNAAGDTNERLVDYMTYFVKHVDKDACDYYSCHKYYASDMTADNYYLWRDFADDMSGVLDINKFVWDEYNTKPEDVVGGRRTSFNGVQLASAQIAQLNEGINRSYLWSLFDQQFPNNYTTNADSFTDGLQMCGTAPSLLVSSIVFPTYYSFSLAANLVGRKGATVYRGEENEFDSIYTTMTKGKDGSLNIMLASTNIMDVDVKLNFEKALDNVTFYRHVYDANDVLCTANGEFIQPDLKLTNVTDSLTDTIKPYSVVVYTTEKFCK